MSSDRSSENMQRARGGEAGSSALHSSEMSRLRHWARLSSVSSGMFSLRALEIGITHNNNHGLITTAGSSVCIFHPSSYFILPLVTGLPSVEPAAESLAKTLLLQQE